MDGFSPSLTSHSSTRVVKSKCFTIFKWLKESVNEIVFSSFSCSVFSSSSMIEAIESKEWWSDLRWPKPLTFGDSQTLEMKQAYQCLLTKQQLANDELSKFLEIRLAISNGKLLNSKFELIFFD